MKIRIGNYVEDKNGYVYKIKANTRYRYDVRLECISYRQRPYSLRSTIFKKRHIVKRWKIVPKIKALLMEE